MLYLQSAISETIIFLEISFKKIAQKSFCWIFHVLSEIILYEYFMGESHLKDLLWLTWFANTVLWIINEYLNMKHITVCILNICKIIYFSVYLYGA